MYHISQNIETFAKENDSIMNMIFDKYVFIVDIGYINETTTLLITIK